jgi:hypothetical protein
LQNEYYLSILIFKLWNIYGLKLLNIIFKYAGILVLPHINILIYLFGGIGKNTLIEKNLFHCFIDKLYKKEWIVYCKAPFKSPEFVLEYLGRYTHRVAISNNRILSCENDKVKFKWRDYADKNKEKIMEITTEEFIRRFIMHILPSKFVKIRHYGILSNRNRSTKLEKCKKLTGANDIRIEDSIKKLTIAEILLKLTGKDINICPCCKIGKMILKEKLILKGYSPPECKTKIA